MTVRRCLEIFETAEAAGVSGAELFLGAAREALTARGRFTVALSGGSSPIPLFRCLAEEAPRAGIDWRAVHVFWADERCVPPEHAESNFRLAEGLFLSKLPAPGAVIHRIAGEESPDEAARRYEADLSASFPGEEIPVFDLLLLGVGSDGHTASLFPGMDLDGFSGRNAVAVYVEKMMSHRVTLTLPVLSSARRIVFFVTGAAKAEIVGEILGGSGEVHYPAALVAASENHVSWLLDREAASGIVNP
ncbi:MAG: 6-phosphogluconolactonase [Geobacteraceae bacterium]|nr:6-phosphogluconolactonase [Geobacteraceae bacterium]